MSLAQKTFSELVATAGITVNGDRPHDIRVHDDRFYRRTLVQGSLGLGESYIDGWWDCDSVDEFFSRIIRAEPVVRQAERSWPARLGSWAAKVINAQSKKLSAKNARAHYDIGNDLYQAMLDPYMVYTCAYWDKADTLDQAQVAKLDLVCRKIGLKPGQSVLDIGCGWGGFARYAAERYGARVVGYNVSIEQVKWARDRCAGLPVEFRLEDYREAEGQYDHVVSIGCLEHVGPKNYRTFLELAHRSLKDDGLLLVHSIGRNTPGLSMDPWIDRYVFPNSVLASASQLAAASEGLFILEDWHSLGADYDKTLMAWYANSERGWDKLPKSYDERFKRMWRYYLLSCAGSFRARTNQLWQVVLSKNGVSGGYRTVR